MNSENFHEYLKNPSKLHQVSYQELKSLVMQYPYSPNLRFLLLLKSMFDQNKDQERNLAMVSMYTPDRSKLRKLVLQYTRLQEIQENYALTEDFLELKDLSSMEDLLEKQPVESKIAPGQDFQIREERQLPSLEKLSEMDDSEVLGFFEEHEDLNFLEDLPEEVDEPLGGTPAPEIEIHEPSGERSEDAGDSSQTVGKIEEDLPALEDLPTDTLEEHEIGETPTAEEPALFLPDEPGWTEQEPIENLAEEDEMGTTFTEPKSPEPGLSETNALPTDPEEGEQEERPILSAREIPLEITNDEELTSDQADGPAPLPKLTFDSWKHNFQAPRSVLIAKGLKNVKAGKKQKTAKKTGKRDEADQIAEQSIQEDSEIASETLALVLSMQGHYEKAISMYERLCLQYPEKSSFFAAKIETLKKKIV